jgi:membrane-associated phospholipid phosphatase
MSPLREVALRAGVAVAALGLWFWTQKLLGARKPPGGTRRDLLHGWTAPLHRRLEGSPRAADAVLIASSACVDLLGLWLLGSAILGPTFRPFVALGSLFALRQACQALVALPAPPGMIWRDPGFPTLLVTYKVGNDFFFSGHTAIAVLGAIEVARAGPPWLGYAAGAIALAEAAVVIVLRAHWTLDVVAGALAAAGCALLADRLAPTVDGWLRLPG